VWCDAGPGQEATQELDAGDEDDEDYLMNLERLRQQREHSGLVGSVWEPSLIICWVVVILVMVGPHSLAQ
jgi:hypothetical protein